MKRAVVLSLTVMLCACASLPPGDDASSNLKRDMNKWVGRSVDALVAAKGAPTETYLLEAGGRVYEYERKVTGKGKSSPPGSNAGVASLPGTFQTTGGDIILPAGAGNIVIPNATAAAPVRSRNKTQALRMPCELQFFISSSNIIESWATEGDCN